VSRISHPSKQDVRYRDPRHDGGLWGPSTVSVLQVARLARDMVREQRGTRKWPMAFRGTGYRPFEHCADRRFEVREGPKSPQAEKVEHI